MENYNFFIDRKINKLFKAFYLDDWNKCYKFTDDEFNQLCNLFGMEKEDFDVVSLKGMKQNKKGNEND